MRIYITHVAGRVDPELFERGVQRLIAAGIEVVHDDRFLRPTHAYLAHADDQVRAADLLTAFRAPAIDAVIAARGGFGTMRTLACLHGEPLLVPGAPRPLIGFSDITALHLYLQNRGLPAIHGPVVTSLGASSDPRLAAQLVKCIVNPEASPALSLRWLLPPRTSSGGGLWPATRLVGGNLALLAANPGLLEPLLADSLLFIEDVGEAPYRLDRALQTLRGLIAHRPPRAVLLGEFTRSGDADLVQASLLDALAAWGIPVAAGLPVGHGESNQPLRLDWTWSLDTRDLSSPRLHIGDPASVEPGSESFAATTRSWTGRAPVRESDSVKTPDAVSTPPFRTPTSPASTITFSSAGGGTSNGENGAQSPDLKRPPEGVDRARLTGVLEALAHRLVQTAASAVAVRVSVGDELVAAVDHGSAFDPQWAAMLGEPERVDASCVFDLASVTKALCTAVLVHRAVDEGAGRLTDRLPPSLSLAQPSILDLLRHCSGLPAHLPFFETLRHAPPVPPTPSEIATLHDRWRRVGPVGPPAHATVYSDVGYILLGRWLEAVAGQPLDRLFHQCIAGPLGLQTLAFRPWSTPAGSEVHPGRVIAATELCPWRGVPLMGVVHDENAQHLGGVAGHAGLFGSADDVLRLAQDLLRPTSTVISARARERMWDRQLSLPGSTWVCGWDTPSPVGSTAGQGHTPGSTFGHLGFTGTSVWVDRSRQLTVVLLTNRVHRGRMLPGFNDWRRAIHQAVLDGFGWSVDGYVGLESAVGTPGGP